MQRSGMRSVNEPSPPRLTDRFPQMSAAECRDVVAALHAAHDDGARDAAISRLLQHQPVLNYGYGTGHTFWRARRLSHGERFEREEDMLWPPQPPGGGRAHRPGTPMLYTASRRDTALAECEPAAGDLFQFVGVRIRARAEARLIPLGEIFAVVRTGISLTGNAEKARILQGLINASGRIAAEGIVYVDAFLDAEFAKPANHALTGSLAAHLLDKAGEPDGILYLSVKQKGGRNLAIRPSAFVQRWSVVSASVVRVRDVLGFGMIATDTVAHADGLYRDGRFRWEEGPPSQTGHIEWSCDEEPDHAVAAPRP